MRRKDREITDRVRMDDIIRSCDCCRLGLNDHGSVYIVPLNFGYVSQGEQATFYFHCAREGKKLDLIAKNPNVGFELDTNHAVNEGSIACEYSFRFRSIIGNGRAALVESMEEKKEALRQIMSHYSDRTDWVFSDAEAAAVAIIRLDVLDIACKEHL